MTEQTNNTPYYSTQYLHVRNWDKWQSYRKDRHLPPWIKMHRRLLRDPNWVALTDAQKGQLVSIWMLAADKNGTVPASPSLLKQLCCLECEPDINTLIYQGFLDAKLTPRRKALRRQLDAPEKSREEESRVEESREEKSREEKKEIAEPAVQPEKEKRNSRKQGIALPADWRPSLRHYALGEELGIGARGVDSAAEDMRLWAEANAHRAVARKSNWDATFSGWMRRNMNNSFTGNNGGGNGHRRPNLKERMSDALQRLGSGSSSENVDLRLPQLPSK